MKLVHCVVVWLVIAGVLFCAPAHSTQVLPINISDMARADLVFTGKCTGVDPHLMQVAGQQGTLPVTTYTFSVPEDGVIKGDVTKTFKFTQAGMSREDSRRLGVMYIIGTPAYEVGKEYILFLSNETSLGLRTTVGFGQGKFSVIADKDGKKQVVNEAGNKGLFVNVPTTKAMTKALSAGRSSTEAGGVQGPIDYDAFVQMVRELTPKKGE